MDRMKSYISLFLLLLLTCFLMVTSDIIGSMVHAPALFMANLLLFVVAFPFIQFKAKISIWENLKNGKKMKSKPPIRFQCPSYSFRS